jgi:hypothetical protein
MSPIQAIWNHQLKRTARQKGARATSQTSSFLKRASLGDSDPLIRGRMGIARRIIQRGSRIDVARTRAGSDAIIVKEMQNAVKLANIDPICHNISVWNFFSFDTMTINIVLSNIRVPMNK